MKFLDNKKNLSMVPAATLSILYALLISWSFMFLGWWFEFDQNQTPDISGRNTYSASAIIKWFISILPILISYILLRKIWYKKWFQVVFITSFVAAFLYVAFVFFIIQGIVG